MVHMDPGLRQDDGAFKLKSVPFDQSLLVPVSSKLLKNLDSGSANNAVRNDGALFAFHVSRISMYSQDWDK